MLRNEDKDKIKIKSLLQRLCAENQPCFLDVWMASGDELNFWGSVWKGHIFVDGETSNYPNTTFDSGNVQCQY